MTVNQERVARRWDKSEWARGIPRRHWSHHPIIDAYINANIIPYAGNMLEWLSRNFLEDGPRERAISLCCGSGLCDRQALAAGVCCHLDGFDISPVSIRIAREEAVKAGLGGRVRYWVDDANTITLEENRYDIALSIGAMHHVEALEHVCGQLRRALKPGSYIFINEFVGPRRFQLTVQQLEIINRVMAVLPPSWRRSRYVTSPLMESMIEGDPSEAIRSDEVVSVLCDNFELVDCCDYGGGLLMPLWERGIIPEVFMEDRGVERQVIIKLMILIDELLAEHGIVTSNFAQLVLRNRPPVPGRTVTKRLSVKSSDRSRWVERWLPGTVFGRRVAARWLRLWKRFRP